MTYPIATVKTKDGIWLHGLFLDVEKGKTVLINIHGTASNFYEEHFIEVISKVFPEKGISVLSTNNRGTGVYDAYQKTGAAVEKFEECILDINAWIELVLSRGYEKIILSGHSLGTEKVVYYMSKGTYADKISGLILFAPADSYGSHRTLNGKDNTKIREKIEELLTISEHMVERGQGDVFLAKDTYGSHTGIMPKSAESLVNFLGRNSKVLEGLPFVTRKLKSYSEIKIPIFVAIGDKEEYTGLTVVEALDLMKKENSLTEITQFKNCDHDFQGCEKELTQSVLSFIKKHGF